jgi:hypothetical protein
LAYRLHEESKIIRYLFNSFTMHKILLPVFFLFIVSNAIGQVIGHVDKKTKEFSVAADQKLDYRVFGYMYANNTTEKMICFSSHRGDVNDNYNRCPLGAYFDTDRMKLGDKIFYLGPIGSFAKMNFVSGDGKKTLFYLPKSSFVIK